ncbi:MAG: hypothetical protein LBQ67_01410 [Treponema sp.]|jgi:hypothetical protein|nr:hypothetical protein [Treponema sp.]
MVNRKHSLAAALFLILGLCSALEGAENTQNEPVSINIRFFDKRIYYLEAEPIYIQMTVTNNGPAAYRFKLADERAFSVDFDVRTTTNRVVEAAGALVRKRSQSRQVYFREISVEAGESFSFVEDLRFYTLLDRSGSYVVQARIFPELYYPEENISFPAGRDGGDGASRSAAGGEIKPLVSNRLSLSLRPRALPGPDGVPLALDVETNAVLVRQKLPPDEVVSYLLTARQKSQWEKYFLYLDLEAMLSRDAYRRRQWLAESEEGRQRMIDRYRRELQSSVIDGDIAAIPSDFVIERTAYNADEGIVTVLEYFKIGGYTEKKRFTYYLYRKDDIWSIIDFSVTNLGTE